MSDPTQPVRRIRRPSLAQPKPPEPDPQEEADRAAAEAEAEARAEREAIQEEARAAEEAQKAREVPPPALPVRSEIRREGHASPVPPGFEPRDGDVLVVTYPEVTLPLPKQYAMMRFGGAIYTRQLRAGDDVDATLTAVSAWLSRRCEADGAAKYKRMVAEFMRGKGE